MTEYTLYMDESETFNRIGDKYFVMSGIIIKKVNCKIKFHIGMEFNLVIDWFKILS